VSGSNVEIERKFVVEQPPQQLEDCRSDHIRQGYLVSGQGDTEVRLRDRDGERTLTVKQGRGRVRAEEEIGVQDDGFERLWPLTEGARLEKRRHAYPLNGDLTVEVDVYEGELEGLIIVEVEFPSEGAAEAFQPPNWFAAEVTDDARFSTQVLATEGRPDGSG
jgi:adenylate cyclase